jgi:hypothetical protein
MSDEIITDAIEEEVRDGKGRFKKGVSGNLAGRKKGTKNKFAKAKLENMLGSAGPEALKLIMETAKKLLEAGKLESGARILLPVFDKYYQLTLYNDKLVLQEQKEKESASDDEASSATDGQVIQVTFGNYSQG